MKKLASFVLAFLVACACASAQDLGAVTEDGRDVILHEDGTWAFAEGAAEGSAAGAEADIPAGSEDVAVAEDPAPGTPEFSTPESAISKVTSKKARFSVYYDPTVWVIDKLKDQDAEYMFTLGDAAVYARLIAEKGSFDLAVMHDAIIANVKKTARSFEVLEEGKAIVNGQEIMTLKAKGKMQGIEVVFYWYYWSGKAGTVQLFGYASRDDFEEHFEDIQDLLNGLSF